jgi:hypothetical protein
MLLTDTLCHSSSIEVQAEAAVAFEFMKQGKALGQWAFGSWNTEPFKGDIFIGMSLFDGNRTYVRIVPHESVRQIDYELGSTPELLLPRIVARVFDGEMMGISKSACIVSVISWRTGGVSDDRWRLTCSVHEAEVFRLRYLIEQI